MVVFAIFLCVSMLVGNAALAQTLEFTSKDWRVFTTTQNGSKVCYIASVPTDKKGNYKNRSEPFAIVTDRGQSAADEVSVSSGYPYKAGSGVTVSVDGKKTAFFTKGERAWAKNSKADTSLIKQMKRGNAMRVRGNSQLGTYSEDRYSLLGFTAAYNKMKTLCR